MRLGYILWAKNLVPVNMPCGIAQPTGLFRAYEKIPKIFFGAELAELARQTRAAGRDSFTYRTVKDGEHTKYEFCENEVESYECKFSIEKEVYEQWFAGIFTKTICEAKNRNQLMKAITMAEELGLTEGEDFFLIKDNCLTELEPEEVDENGVGRTLTCIGFRPLPDEVAHKISRKYQLYSVCSTTG